MKKRLVGMLLALGILFSALPIGAIGASAADDTAAVTVGEKTYIVSVGSSFTYELSFDYAAENLATAQIELPVDFSGLSGYTQAEISRSISKIAPATFASSVVQRFDTPNTFGLTGYVMNFASANGFSFLTPRVVLSLAFTVEKAGSYTLSAKIRYAEDVDGRVAADGNYVRRDIRLRTAETFADAVLDTPAPKAATYAGGMLISWDAVPHAALYRVYKKINNSWSRIGDIAAPSFLDTDVISGESYTYTVRCLSVDATRFLSDFDRAGASATYYAAPILSLSSTDDGVSIRWDAVAGASRYRVYRKNGSSWTRIADTSGTSLTDTDVTPGESYTYTARTLNSAGNAFLSYFYPDGFSVIYTAGMTYLLGDADHNGEVESVDAAFVLRCAAQMDVPVEKELIALGGDIDGDGRLTAMDASFIQAYLAQMQTAYPIGTGKTA